MLATLIIVFREVIEAGLVLGIVLSATRGVPRRGLWVGGGVVSGIAGAGLVALFAEAIANSMAGAGQELFNASVMAVAVLMLTGHNVWMAREGRHMAQEMNALGKDVVAGQRSLMALALVVCAAVLREGSEVVLFLFGIAAASKTSGLSMAAGGAAGLALAGALSWLLYRGLVAIPLRHLFSVTNGLIALLAAGMAGQAAAILHGADILPGWGEQVWDTGFVLDDASLLGRTAHALIGYSARPCGIQLAAWLATLAGLRIAARAMNRPRLPARTATAAAG